MDATSTGPQHLRRQWGENRVYNRTLDYNAVKRKYRHTDMLKLRWTTLPTYYAEHFVPTCRLHDRLTTSTKRSSICLTE